MLGAQVMGRHLTVSHSLVRVRWIPTSRPGFCCRSLTASGNYGVGTITSTEVMIPFS